ncbi:MAG: hypothetical protein IJ520_12625 [Synergistaceae bacterium]|nr:hypothetical protein [Synergistaceae bacterium]
MGKRTRFDEFTVHHRASGGIMAMNLSQRTGRLVGCNAVKDSDEIIAITARGRMIRLAVSDTPLVSRTAMGNILVRPGEDDSIVDCSIVRIDDEVSEPEVKEAKEAKADDATLDLNLN